MTRKPQQTGPTAEPRPEPTPWMYRPTPEPHPKSGLLSTTELWPFLIEKQGTPNRCDWGILIAKVWQHPAALAHARLIVQAANGHEKLMALADAVCEAFDGSTDPVEESLREMALQARLATTKPQTEMRRDS